MKSQSDLTRFTGDIKYPLPGRKATAVKLGKGGNGFVFSIFHNGKEYAVKKVTIVTMELHHMTSLLIVIRLYIEPMRLEYTHNWLMLILSILRLY